MAGRTLVAYFTKGGASETYAKMIAKTLGDQGVHVDLVNLKTSTPQVEQYDNVIIGTGVRMFMVYRRWKKVLKQKPLNEKRLFLFLSSGMAIDDPEGAVHKYLEPVVGKLKLKPVAMVSFPGLIPEKWIEEGQDKETVKPEKAKAWVLEIAGKLR